MFDPFAPYADLYKETSGPGDQRPTALHIVRDNDLVDKWTGRVALVTGGTSGIGVETVRALHATGADVYFTARDVKKAISTRDDILGRSHGKGRLDYIELDLDSLQAVRNANAAFLEKSDKLNLLVCNAGIMGCPYTKTVDGFERQFAVNHLAHYLLASLLLPALEASSSPGANSRIVFVSSSSHRYSQIRWDDYNYDNPGSYDSYKAYAQGKTGMIWTANYIDRVFGPRGVNALSVHPGGIWSGLQTYTDPAIIEQWKVDTEISSVMQTEEQGAATTVWAAVGRVWEGKGGEYLSDCGIAGPAKDLESTMEPGAAPFVHEPESEDRLWELSARLVGRPKDL